MRSVTGLGYTAIERWIKRFRRHIPLEDLPKLSGVVKVDESFFGKRRSKQPQIIVVGAIDADTKQIRLEIISDREQETLEDFVCRNIELGSVVITDYWLGYVGLNDLDYDHYAFNHSRGQFAHTNQIESLWSEIKRFMRRVHGNVRTGDLELILREWVMRHEKPDVFEDPMRFLGYCLFRLG
jgi:hypothetical protein